MGAKDGGKDYHSCRCSLANHLDWLAGWLAGGTKQACLQEQQWRLETTRVKVGGHLNVKCVLGRPTRDCESDRMMHGG